MRCRATKIVKDDRHEVTVTCDLGYGHLDEFHYDELNNLYWREKFTLSFVELSPLPDPKGVLVAVA